MEILAAAIISLSAVKHSEMAQLMSCPAAQSVIANLYASESVSEAEKQELLEVILEHTPINCPLPQNT